ncbi:TBC1 domain family member 22B isoform X1 [Octodon degus]|uniref:TBC1 domain family member 22B isoform X1 n=1 Tax=Octodon degus TaxID=10160 RepID=A0A6P6EUP9_OCTDE|nr:TBC1 domain family member 22B isoform X1 [Octodon degus]
MAAENSKQFWKRSAKLPGSIQPVYGAQHPPLDPRLSKNFIKERSKVNTVPLKNKKASSFHEFARNTSDAWDIGDDEEEDFSSPSFQTLNSKVALATAAQVLENHSKLRVKPERSQSTSCEVPASYKVLKSSSDAQLSRNASDTCLRNPLHKQQSLPLRPIIPLVARISDQNASGAPPMTVREKTRLEKFRQLLSSHNTDLDELRKCSWPGVPREVRPVTWRLLSGYLPANTERRKLTLQRKREEYFGFIEQYYDSRNEEHHQDTYRQIHIDIPRTNPLIPLFQQPLVQEIFERILFIWAIRHPASGYVQGINDLVTPFFVVFLSEYVEEDVENFDVTNLSQDRLRSIEADSFWCMSKLLDGIQDNYTFAQPGIQRKVKALEELVSRIDEQVHNHFRRYEVEYLQFAFRWMNNLLMRELPLRCTIRLWDTYQSEPEGFSHFHLYVCAAFLIKWRKEILDEEDFQGLLMLLQNLPTIHWGNEEIGLLLAEAYRLKYLCACARSVLASPSVRVQTGPTRCDQVDKCPLRRIRVGREKGLFTSPNPFSMMTHSKILCVNCVIMYMGKVVQIYVLFVADMSLYLYRASRVNAS